MSNGDSKEQRRNTHMKGGKQEAYSIQEEMLISQCLETYCDYINDGLNYVKSRRKRKFGLHAYVQKILKQNDIHREENKIKSHIAKIAKSKFMDTHILKVCKKYELHKIIKKNNYSKKRLNLTDQIKEDHNLKSTENVEIDKEKIESEIICTEKNTKDEGKIEAKNDTNCKNIEKIDQNDENAKINQDFSDFMKDKSNDEIIQQKFDTSYFMAQGPTNHDEPTGKQDNSFYELEKVLKTLRKMRAYVDENTIF